MIYDEKLSDIDINTHGFTQDDIIRDRIARKEAIAEAATRGNKICQESERMDALAKSYGIDVTYSEDLDDDDMGGIF